ncbi:carboxymuconolactone decarboxylase family protein [Psychrosphaera sp. B3R10]|uniref:Carboxymuconolactone decarboxylase family protein n=1 Tax=Psychrosphaera algicola TaxID=3023714 RepID=A0ABT5FAQ5_9GAMM|nr:MULTISPECIES: carboxymuconolactone decarboxylase family protein [unclassified Psychrosphaera]MBU2880560.1 carboxymuconolactone decarboxylase family protein [Psychrosphaera sp. I2R16]MBU2989119.1 carboxymuconolactone decarboxylase family protein [Psychrosphaera sp. B3R10]MDC2887707.1 carboxymuconolactone decarboxylase family protein [Psychrosphaera sp. G1-22]MDO6717775.1 carboxymuconolactone decarboxylase family protein [Psychrosphaera sp. 1_MG-2023]
MTSLTIHTIESSPAESKPVLEQSVKTNGMLPNLHGVLASAPSTLKAYQSLHQLFMDSSFNAEELTVVWQGINVEHGCTYCVPAHTAIAHSMKVDPAITEALRNQTALPTAKLQALLDMTLIIVRHRGHVTPEELAAFYAAGYGEQQVLEIILGLSQKVISNYTNHIANTPLDAPFQPFGWEKS